MRKQRSAKALGAIGMSYADSENPNKTFSIYGTDSTSDASSYRYNYILPDEEVVGFYGTHNTQYITSLGLIVLKAV